MTIIEGPAIAAPKVSKDLDGIVRQTSHRYGLDYRLVHAVIHAESRGNPKAISPKGAIGVMQVMPATGQRYGVMSAAALRDPAVNIDVGVRYLRDLSAMFNRTELVVAAYNAGEGRVIKAGYVIPQIPETRAYVAQVLSFYNAQRALTKGIFP
ncbi:MAG: lytic transglycosylase domain-containing protein [Burkholderiales bacterium]|nr:lytic transglycosylase domain-containing protein [Burkholderiales bacterium]